VLCSPGHPLFAAMSEALDRDLAAAGVPGGVAGFVDPSATVSYWVHCFAFEVIGESATDQPETAHAEVVAVLEGGDDEDMGQGAPGGRLAVAPSDVLHDLTPTSGAVVEPPAPEVVEATTNWVRVNQQVAAIMEERQRRQTQAELRAAYLDEALTA